MFDAAEHSSKEFETVVAVFSLNEIINPEATHKQTVSLNGH